MESTQDRLATFVKYTGLSDHQFTLKSGLSNGLLANITKKKASFTNDTIEKVLHAFPELNIEWILKGEGHMLKQKGLEESLALKEPSEQYQAPKKENVIFMFPENAETEFPIQNKNGLDRFCLPWLLGAGVFWAFRVTGDSMGDTLFNGDHVVAKELERPDWIRHGEIHVLLTQKGIHIKRVWKQEETLKLISDNESYGSEEIPLASVRAAFIVMEKISSRLNVSNKELIRIYQKLLQANEPSS